MRATRDVRLCFEWSRSPCNLYVKKKTLNDRQWFYANACLILGAQGRRCSKTQGGGGQMPSHAPYQTTLLLVPTARADLLNSCAMTQLILTSSNILNIFLSEQTYCVWSLKVFERSLTWSQPIWKCLIYVLRYSA